MVWYGMLCHWYGMARYGMVWYGMVWYCMVWYGMADVKVPKRRERYRSRAVLVRAKRM